MTLYTYIYPNPIFKKKLLHIVLHKHTEHSLQTLSFLATSRDYTIPSQVRLCYLTKKTQNNCF